MSATLSRPLARTKRAPGAGVSRTAANGTSVLDELIAGWRPVLDALGTNIFLADLDLTLVFANRRAWATLKTIEPTLQASFGISAKDIVGGSIHRFHKDPARVERVLHQQGFTLPHDATFGFGAVSLSTKIDAVHDAQGTHVGYAVAWEDVSALTESQNAVRELGEHLDTAAAAVEELGVSIGEIARSASQAADTTSRGLDDAEHTQKAVLELDDASSAIGEVVRTISTIAAQTNILALNATIEAARAGEAGKGFAVVAGEVKQLARDTATATDDISRRIGVVRSSVTEVANSIEGIAALLREVNEIQSTVASTVEEQRVATDQLGQSVAEAATASREMVEG
jgi:uncharacterized protein YoxC